MFSSLYSTFLQKLGSLRVAKLGLAAESHLCVSPATQMTENQYSSLEELIPVYVLAA